MWGGYEVGKFSRWVTRSRSSLRAGKCEYSERSPYVRFTYVLFVWQAAEGPGRRRPVVFCRPWPRFCFVVFTGSLESVFDPLLDPFLRKVPSSAVRSRGLRDGDEYSGITFSQSASAGGWRRMRSVVCVVYSCRFSVFRHQLHPSWPPSSFCEFLLVTRLLAG